MITHLLHLTLQRALLQLIWMNGGTIQKAFILIYAFTKIVPVFHILTILVRFMDLTAVFISYPVTTKSTIIHLQETC
jgi:hypothetical protein